MSEIVECTRGSLNPLNGFKTLWYKFNNWRENPTYFNPDGIWVFCGPQGCGKTLSAVQTLQMMVKRYPRARVISNMPLHNVPANIEPFEGYEQLGSEDNGVEGVIFFLDEIHVLWNSLESKQIPISEMAVFCQMRKARRVILGTTQVYGRVAKPIREQLKYVIMCHNIGGFFQYNQVCDPQYSTEENGIIKPDVIRTQYWFHRPSLYESYETLGKIERIDRKPFVIQRGKEIEPWNPSQLTFTPKS